MHAQQRHRHQRGRRIDKEHGAEGQADGAGGHHELLGQRRPQTHHAEQKARRHGHRPRGHKDRTGEIGAVQVLGKRHRGRVEQAEERPGEGVDHEQHAHRRGGGEAGSSKARTPPRQRRRRPRPTRPSMQPRPSPAASPTATAASAAPTTSAALPAASPCDQPGYGSVPFAEHKHDPDGKGDAAAPCPPPARWRQRAR